MISDFRRLNHKGNSKLGFVHINNPHHALILKKKHEKIERKKNYSSDMEQLNKKKNAGNATSNGGIRSSYSSECHHTKCELGALHSKEYNICQFMLIPRGIKTHTLELQGN